MRVASAIFPPYTEVYTDDEGVLHVEGGIETIFLKAISAYDDVIIDWTDIVQAEGDAWWGTKYPNGTVTGLLKYIMEYKTDVSALQNYCSYHFAG